MTQYVMADHHGGSGGRYDPRWLRQRAIRQLLETLDASDEIRGIPVAKVTAASRLLSHSEWAEERNDATKESQFFKLFPNDAAAAKWLLENRDQLLKIAGLSSQNLIASDAQAMAIQTEHTSDDTQAELGQQDQEDASEAPRR